MIVAHTDLDRLRRDNAALQRRVDDLEAENDQLKSVLLASQPAPAAWGLTTHEQVIFGVLVSREVGSRDAIMTALYSQAQDERSPKIVDVFICKMRQKLPSDVKIRSVPNLGYKLDEEVRRRFKTKTRDAVS